MVDAKAKLFRWALILTFIANMTACGESTFKGDNKQKEAKSADNKKSTPQQHHGSAASQKVSSGGVIDIGGSEKPGSGKISGGSGSATLTPTCKIQVDRTKVLTSSTVNVTMTSTGSVEKAYFDRGGGEQLISLPYQGVIGQLTEGSLKLKGRVTGQAGDAACEVQIEVKLPFLLMQTPFEIVNTVHSRTTLRFHSEGVAHYQRATAENLCASMGYPTVEFMHDRDAFGYWDRSGWRSTSDNVLSQVVKDITGNLSMHHYGAGDPVVNNHWLAQLKCTAPGFQ